MKILLQDRDELLDSDDRKSMDIGIGNRIRLFEDRNCEGEYTTVGIYDSYDVACEIYDDMKSHMEEPGEFVYIMPSSDEEWNDIKAGKTDCSEENKLSKIFIGIMDLRSMAIMMNSRINKLIGDFDDVMGW